MANIPAGRWAVRVNPFASAARTATANSDTMPGVDRYTGATIFLDVTAASGTSETLNVYVQKELPDNASWQDVVSFTQATGVTSEVAEVVSGGNAVNAEQSGALTAGTINTGLLGGTWRVRAVIAGTNPSFTFQVAIDFFE